MKKLSTVSSVLLLAYAYAWAASTDYSVKSADEIIPAGNYQGYGFDGSSGYGILSNVGLTNGISSNVTITATAMSVKSEGYTGYGAFGVYLSGGTVGDIAPASIRTNCDDWESIGIYLSGTNVTGGINSQITVESSNYAPLGYAMYAGIQARNSTVAGTVSGNINSFYTSGASYSYGIYASGSTFKDITADIYTSGHGIYLTSNSIVDGAITGTISGMESGICAENSTMNGEISGDITGYYYGISVYNSAINETISGTITSNNYGVSLANESSAKRIDADITASSAYSNAYGVYASNSSINGAISGSVSAQTSNASYTSYALYYSSTSDVAINVSGDSTYNAKNTADSVKAYAIYSEKSGFALAGDGNTQTLTGSLRTGSSASNTGGDITIGAGNYIFDNYGDSSLWQAGFSGEHAITIAEGARATFEKSTTMNAGDIAFDGDIILKAATNTEYVSLTLSTDYAVGDNATISLYLGADFEIYEGLALYLIKADEGIYASFDKINVFDSKGRAIPESIYTWDGYTLVFIGIPEPAACALVAGALVLALAAYRRRRA